MKKILKTVFLTILTATLVFMVIGCELGGKDNDRDNVDGVDWKSYSGTDRAFNVSNNTTKDLVAFKGSVQKDNILGGIPGSAKGHGIKTNSTLLNSNQDFPLILITKEDYIANMNDPTALAGLNQTPFTRIYVFYNANGDNDINYEISGRLGGTNLLEIGNPSTTLNVELRLGGIYGETIGYAPAGMNITKLYVSDGDLDIFPVFKRYNNIRDVVETIYPSVTGQDNVVRAWFQPLAFEGNSAYFNVQDAINALSARTSGVAWLSIQNSTSGAIRLIKGNEVVRTSTGVSYFNTGSKTFTIDMPSVEGAGGSGTFVSSVTIGNYKVGPNSREVNITDKDGNTSFTLKADKLYVVTVDGDHNLGTLKAIIDLDEDSETGPTDVPLEL